MHPITTLVCSLLTPPALALVPSVLARQPLTPYHWTACVAGWLVAIVFWFGARHRERVAAMGGAEDAYGVAERLALRAITESRAGAAPQAARGNGLAPQASSD